MFAPLRRVTVKFGNCTNIKAVFPFQWCRPIFPNLFMSKVGKTVKRSIFIRKIPDSFQANLRAR